MKPFVGTSVSFFTQDIFEGKITTKVQVMLTESFSSHSKNFKDKKVKLVYLIFKKYLKTVDVGFIKGWPLTCQKRFGQIAKLFQIWVNNL